MKLNELISIMNDNQFVDVFYKDNSDNLVKCASRNTGDTIDEKYDDAEVVCVAVTKYNTFDVIIEKPITNKRYTLNFTLPSWVDFEEEVVIEFEDDEDEDDIRERISEEFGEWLDNKIDEIRCYADKEITEVEEY